MKVQTVINAMLKHPEYHMEIANEYGVPGFRKRSDLPILIAQWEYAPKLVYKRLESMGFTLEWYNQWIIDDGKAYCCSLFDIL
jgi:hypothetical protein